MWFMYNDMVLQHEGDLWKAVLVIKRLTNHTDSVFENTKCTIFLVRGRIHYRVGLG